MKKSINFMGIFLLLFLLTGVSFAEESQSKKVVSIVYDDSGSMRNDNNYYYSDYALQILTASMGENDELNIVKMSEYFANNEIDLKSSVKRQKFINEIQGYEHNGGTPFESVNSAKNWLINKSTTYKDDAEYWLVVITDGAFSGLPTDINQYFTDLNNSFNNLNFEFILLSIGNSTDIQLKNIVKSSANSSVIEAYDNESIYSSLLNIAQMINSGATDKIVSVEKSGENKIKVTAEYPLKKMMVLIQNSDNSIKSVRHGNNKLGNENFKVQYPAGRLKGNLTHVLANTVGYLNSGEYVIEFNENINLDKNITFLCEAFISCEISLVDDSDNPLNNAQMNFLTKNSPIKVKCEIFNGADGSKLENIDSDLGIQLINNKNKYKMKYDKNKKAFYTDISVIEGKNNIYAIVEETDLYRIKSNVILIDTVVGEANIEHYKNNLMEIEVPYSSSKEYKEVSQFVFEFVDSGDYNQAQEFELELVDLPKGIKIEYQGKQYKNEDEIPMLREIGKKYVLKILVNKDYDDTEETIITLKMLSEGAGVYWASTGFDEEYIKIVPKAYSIKMVNKNYDFEIDVQNEKLILNVVRIASETEDSKIVGFVNVEDIKKIKSNDSFSSGFGYKISKNEKDNTIDVEIVPNIFALFGKDSANVDIEILLKNEFETGTYKEEIKVININVWAILRPYMIVLAIVVIVLGYVTKNKFNKKTQISITESGDTVSYALRPELKTLLLPFVSHKAKIGLIEFKAGSGSDLIFSGRNLTITSIDGESFDEYTVGHSVNLDKMVLKKDLSNIVIEAFDVVQKYEYLTKEVDMGDYSSDDYSSDYTDDDYTQY